MRTCPNSVHIYKGNIVVILGIKVCIHNVSLCSDKSVVIFTILFLINYRLLRQFHNRPRTLIEVFFGANLTLNPIDNF